MILNLIHFGSPGRCTGEPEIYSVLTLTEDVLVVLTPPAYDGGDFLWKYSVRLLQMDRYVLQ